MFIKVTREKSVSEKNVHDASDSKSETQQWAITY